MGCVVYNLVSGVLLSVHCGVCDMRGRTVLALFCIVCGAAQPSRVLSGRMCV